ncbi:hypothetical protein [Dyadobacter pollutisoli]|uniref:hypothetical protein n=1 Tax=Dyadobacter pollutisoli TaxID=2910158 RepID=UPI001FD22E15|nr:hypothetical protein [Dyadobacter pollutisoli]
MSQSVTKSKALSKAERLKWEPVSTVKPTAVTSDTLAGKRLSEDDLLKNANNHTKFRIP